MKKKNYAMLGVMSGTSLDGIDVVYCHFDESEKGWTYMISKAETIPYPPQWHKKLAGADSLNAQELEQLDWDYTHFLGKIIEGFLQKNSIKNIDAIASHGHTVLHRPEKGLTRQIGNLPVLASLVQQKVVCDFRVQDVKLGGQGAPLVPVGDRFLFPDYDHCLNLGGFANISSEKNNERIAYDICPVNTVLNFYAQKLGKKFDAGGKIAAKAEVDLQLLRQLEALPFYREPPPKSLGIEWVRENVIPLCERNSLPAEVVLATVSVHVAKRIGACIPENSSQKILITGGGAYNSFILKKLREFRPVAIWSVPETGLIEFKEALIFAFLGVLRLRNVINVLKSVTGACKNHSAGYIYLPKKI